MMQKCRAGSEVSRCWSGLVLGKADLGRWSPVAAVGDRENDCPYCPMMQPGRGAGRDSAQSCRGPYPAAGRSPPTLHGCLLSPAACGPSRATVTGSR